MNEPDALLIVSENNGKSMDEMLAIARQKGFSNDLENKLRFQSLYEQDFITGTFVLGLPVNITLVCKARLELLQKEADQFTKEKRDRNRNKKIAIATILIPFVIFVLEIIKDNFQFLISPFSNLFR